MQLVALILFALLVVLCIYVLPSILLLLILVSLCVIEVLEWLWNVITWPFRKLLK